MNRAILNLLALVVISGGGAHLLAQQTPPGSGDGDNQPVCCTALFGSRCCGATQCRAGWWTCCADSACEDD